MGGALSKLTPELDDVGDALDDLVVRDLVVGEARADDQRRARVQVQARAHP